MMNGMPTTDKDPIIMSPGEIAVTKRRFMFEKLKKDTGADPFKGRFICEFSTIAHFAKKIVETHDNINLNPYLEDGIGGSKILPIATMFEDMSSIEPIIEHLKQHFEKYRIWIGLWKNTYSFESFKEMIQQVLEVLFSEPSKRIESKDNND